LRKSLKRQIKEDELVSGYASAGVWIRAHADQVKTGAVAALVLAVAVGGLLYFRSQRVSESQRAFDDGLEAFGKAVAQPAQEGAPAAKEERLKAALAALDGVAGRYGSLAVGLRARYYAALCRLELGERDKAEPVLREIAEKGKTGAMESALAELALARIERAQGGAAPAIVRYEKLLGTQSVGLPRDYLLMSLAAALEEAGRPKDAAAGFRRVVEETPSSPFAGDARSRAQYLKLAALNQ
jgi:tetratricopeptide (TPR) repeat protein